MHLVCIRVVTKLLHFWLRGALAVWLSARSVSLILQKLVSMRGSVTKSIYRVSILEGIGTEAIFVILGNSCIKGSENGQKTVRSFHLS